MNGPSSVRLVERHESAEVSLGEVHQVCAKSEQHVAVLVVEWILELLCDELGIRHAVGLSLGSEHWNRCEDLVRPAADHLLGEATGVEPCEQALCERGVGERNIGPRFIEDDRIFILVDGVLGERPYVVDRTFEEGERSTEVIGWNSINERAHGIADPRINANMCVIIVCNRSVENPVNPAELSPGRQ